MGRQRILDVHGIVRDWGPDPFNLRLQGICLGGKPLSILLPLLLLDLE